MVENNLNSIVSLIRIDEKRRIDNFIWDIVGITDFCQ